MMILKMNCIYHKDYQLLCLFVEVDFLWNRTVDSLKTSFHPLSTTVDFIRSEG